MTKNMIKAGDVQVLKVNLYSPYYNIPFDLSLVWQHISIFEDIKLNYIRGEITIVDTQNLPETIPIIGNERIQIEFKTPSEDSSAAVYVGQVINVKSRLQVNQGSQLYVIEFISTEFVRNHQLKFSKAYQQMLISDIVQDIYNQYLKPVSNKSISIVPTLNMESKVVPNFSPMKTINWLTKWARSPVYRSGASYIFFENQYGYYFGPIESLIDPDVYKNPVATYYRNIVHAQTDETKDINIGFYTVTDMKNNVANHLGNIKKGLYASSMQTHDIVRRTIEHSKLNYFDVFPEIQHLNNNKSKFDTQIFNDIGIGEYSDSYQVLNPNHYAAFDDNIDSNRSDVTQLIRNSQLRQYDSIEMEITIPGDSQRTIGEVIELRLPAIGLSSLEGNEDKYLSGNFLILALRHDISRPDQSGRITHSSQMVVSKDTVKNPLSV